MKQIELTIEGMSCGHCVAAVKGALDEEPGARVETVVIGRASIEYDEERTDPERLAAAVRNAGYATEWRAR